MATTKKGTRSAAGQVAARVEEPQQEHTSPFEAIRRINEYGNEFWSARDLAKVLGYTRYDKFANVIKKAEVACAASGNEVDDHMFHVRHMVQVGSGAMREVRDVNLSRYACYLTVQNADPTKEIVALAQTYFAVQTRRQETFDQVFGSMDEAQRRLFMHNQMVTQNEKLKAVAGQAGVVTAEDFAIFQNHGYMGLYGGLHEKDLQQRKGLSDNQNVLDYMSSEELISNLFRSSQTESKMARDAINQKEQANSLHKEVGSAVRQTIEQLGGTLPENLPTPAASIQELKQHQDSAARQLLQNTPVVKPGKPKSVTGAKKPVQEVKHE
jgi:DNA-damage-inducible protein D